MKKEHWAKSLIEKSGLSKADMTKACECSYPHFSNVLNGIYGASPELEAKISEVLAIFDSKERAKRSFALPLSIKKTIIPAFRRIPVARIGIDPLIVREPAPETREELLAAHEKVQGYTQDMEYNRPLPPILAVQVDRLNHYLLLGRAVLQAAKNSMRCSVLEGYVYDIDKCDVPYLSESEIIVPVIPGNDLESEKEN